MRCCENYLNEILQLLRQLYRNWSEGTMEGVIEMEDGSTQMEHAEVCFSFLKSILWRVSPII